MRWGIWNLEFGIERRHGGRRIVGGYSGGISAGGAADLGCYSAKWLRYEARVGILDLGLKTLRL